MVDSYAFDEQTAEDILDAVDLVEGQEPTSYRPRRTGTTTLPDSPIWQWFKVLYLPGQAPPPVPNDQYYTGNIVTYDGTTENVLVQNIRGAAINAGALEVGIRYPARITPTVDAKGTGVFGVDDAISSVRTPLYGFINGASPSAQNLYDGTLENGTMNQLGFTPGGPCWIWSPTGEQLQNGQYYPLSFTNGSFTAVPAGGGGAVSRPLYFAGEPGIGSGETGTFSQQLVSAVSCNNGTLSVTTGTLSITLSNGLVQSITFQ